MRRSLTIQIIATLSATLILSGCHDSNHYETHTPEDLYGVWERTGYGDIWVVDKNGGKLYQHTRQTCILNDTLDEKELNNTLKNRKLQYGKQSFTAIPFKSPVFEQHYDRLDELPSKCQSDQLITTATPTLQFEHFWHNFNDYYGFLNQRNVDWQQQYTSFQSTITDDMTQEALFNVFAEMLSPINDSHTGLSVDGLIEEVTFGQPSPLAVDLQTAFQQQSALTNFYEFEFNQMNKIRQVQYDYLPDGKTAGGPDGQLAFWGTIAGNIGYLNVDRMIAIDSDFDFAADGFDLFSDDIMSKELLAMESIMNKVVSDLKDVDALVIDVRLNGGGLDNVAMVIANHFTRERRLALSKYTNNWQGKTRELNAYLKPTKQRLQVPIAILTSKDTGSAAESLVMAMLSLPEVSIVGERSEGITSTTLKKSLLNGIQVTLSNELLLDHDGRNYEATGIPVDIPTTAFDLEGFAEGKDTALDEAVSHLNTLIQ